jgi:hypothetical protein
VRIFGGFYDDGGERRGGWGVYIFSMKGVGEV